MKKLAGLVVILAALVLGGYYVMGIATERTVKHNLDTVNQSNGLNVVVAEYNRGWFTSFAILNWTMQVPERVVKSADGQSQVVPAQNYTMKMPLTVYHGPFIFADKTVKFGLGYARSDIHIPAEYNQQFNATFTGDSTQPVLDISFFVNYLNNSQIDLTVPEFKLVAKQGGQLDWMGMNSSVNVTSDADKVEGKFTIVGLLFNKDDMKAVLGNIISDYNLHQTSNGLYLGDASISMPSLVVTKKDDKLFELSKFEVYTSSDINDGLFSTHFKSSIQKIIANGKNFGPGSLEISLRNLDAEVLARINQQINTTQHGTDTEKQQAMLAMLPEIPKLFSKGAEFELSELSFAMPQGTIEGNLLITLPAGDTSNPFMMLQKVEGKGKVKIPADVIKLVLNEMNKQKVVAQTAAQPAPATADSTSTSVATAQPAGSIADTANQAVTMTEAQLTAMLESGFIVKEGNYYVLEVAFVQGNLSVNGKPFTPAMVKF